MRLIGNKTRLLSSIEALLRGRGITSGTFIDIFSGSASVGRHFKRRGFRVVANDRLSACHTQAVAGVEVSRYPSFERLRRAHAGVISSREFRETLAFEPEFEFLRDREAAGKPARPRSTREREPGQAALPLREAIHLIDRFVPARDGLVFRNYCPGGLHGRRYFQDHHGRKIDGVLEFLREAHLSGVLDRGELHLLLAALIDAADRVANISGTYGAYLKSWQHNTRGEMRIETPEVIESPLRHEAHQADANALIREVTGDVLYIDPPYNHRQYAANYHILEILAEHHRIADLASYEAALYGKTGLRPYQDLKSDYSVRPGGRGARSGNVLTALSDLILSSRAKCVVVSYNLEGLLSREEIGAILARFSRARSFDFDRDLVEIDHPRFRSDADRPPVGGRGGRSYRVIDGKERDRIGELLFFAARPAGRSLRAAGGAARAPASRG